MPTYQNKTDYNRFNQSNPSYQGYDLELEKQKIAEEIAETKKELLEKWKKQNANAQIFPNTLSGMDSNLIFFLLSFEHALFYDDLAKKFNLSQKQRDALPHIVWQLCRTKEWEDINGLLEKNLGIDSAACNQIAQDISSRILSKARELSLQEPLSKNSVGSQEQNAPSLMKMPIFQALKEIPDIGEQIITSQRIKILSFPESVRPSLANWLADYTSYFGYEKHSAIEIGNYLFHSENTKKMSSSDRQKLTYILKSFNDETPISINKTTRQIVFPPFTSPAAGRNVPETLKPKIQTAPATSIAETESSTSRPIEANKKNDHGQPYTDNNSPQTTNYPPRRPASTSREQGEQASELQTNKMTFSSPQKLPYEYEKDPIAKQKKYFSTPQSPDNLPVKPYQSSTPKTNTVVLEKKPAPPRPSGKNVVNLREI
ncbi:MAG TPA: hypothetical protein DIC35_03350 [Candidatus Moranbacteria bacterium]|nr:hypothetical protein [Candidatus Moranbacteria bacterium]